MTAATQPPSEFAAAHGSEPNYSGASARSARLVPVGADGARSLQDRLTHLDLFSGIGGFALAAKWAGFKTVGFCEYNPKARRILTKNFPGVPIHEDVRTLEPKQYEGTTLITGGYPCQPFSHAGQRRGEEDDRHLWPAMRRIIEGARPRWVLAENVAGHVTLGLDTVLSELESIGYSCWATVIPACAVGALHRRDRVWIVGHSNSAGCGQGDSPLAGGETEQPHGNGEPDTHAKREQREGGGEGADSGDASIQGESGRVGGERPWCEWTPEPGMDRVAHGIPGRVDRLHGLGNAIVPQVALEILRSLAAIELGGAVADVARAGVGGGVPHERAKHDSTRAKAQNQ